MTVMEGRVEMFTTTWCGYCTRLKRFMDAEGIAYEEVNIEHDPEAAEFVMAVNGGNRTVPTVRLPNGTALTNPSPAQLLDQLRRSA